MSKLENKFKALKEKFSAASKKQKKIVAICVDLGVLIIIGIIVLVILFSGRKDEVTYKEATLR